LVFWLVSTGLADRVLAADDPSAPGAASTVVMLAERHQELETDAIVRAVHGQLSDLSVALEVRWVDALPAAMPDQIDAAEHTARGSDAVAVFWCDLGRADRIYLYFAAPRGGRVLVRELGGAGSGGRAEALAIIVRSSVEAVLAGGEVGVVVAPRAAEVEQEPAVETEPPPGEPAPGPERALALSVAYDLDILSEALPATHGVALGLDVRVAGPLSVELGYLIAFPFSRAAHGAELTLRRHPLWLGLRAAWLTGNVVLSASVWLQLDVVTEEVRSLDPAVVIKTGGTEVVFSIVPLLRAGYLLAGRVELFVAAGVDIPFRRVRYVVDDPEGPLEIIDTWPARPRIIAGLSVGLW
jgi:hypothetical protein